MQRKANKIEAALVHESTTIQDTLVHMNQEAALVVDDDGRLSGIVTDGDLRRAFLRGASMETPVLEIMTRNPVTVTPETSRSTIRSIMLSRSIRHLPVVDADLCPVALELFKMQELDDDMVKAVIMAGGKGTRLAPLTHDTPKPLLDFGDSTILDTILDGLHDNGVEDVVLTVNYLREKIKSHVGDGSSHDMHVRYVEEPERMGTAGSLVLMDPRPTNSFIVMNGDLITELDFKALAEFHRQEKNDITVCVRRDKVSIPYGVVTIDADNQRIQRLDEKPDHEFLVNAGIYMLEPSMIDLIPQEGYFDMTSLINKGLEAGKRVGAFAVIEYWRDIGRHQEMARASEEWEERRKKKPMFRGSVPAFLF
jgi:dTDP-glucose pyrophosphorylase